MKNCGLIIINAVYKSKSTIYQVNRITEEFKKLSIKIDTLENNLLLGLIEDGDIKTTIQNKYDFVIFLDKDINLCYMLEKLGMRVFNRAKAIEICDDKMKTHIKLSGFNINMPKTIRGLVTYIYDDKLQNKIASDLERELKYPFILKESHSSLGLGVYLIPNKDVFSILYVKEFNKPHLYQELIKTSIGKDVRLILVNKKVVACMKRESTNGDFKSNIALGGTATKFSSNNANIMAEKIASILDLDYCGIDLLFGSNENEFYLCEVNSNAYFEKIEEVTNVNVAESYASYIYDEIYKKY